MVLWCVAAFAPFANAQVANHLDSTVRSSASLTGGGPHGAAIDAKGVVHYSTEYTGVPPWLKDPVKTVAPEYPQFERHYGYQGTGIIRLILDLRTGSVTDAIVVKSTGFAGLDQSAISAFKRWTWKPGKWKEIYMPVTFAFGHPPLPNVPL
jgi:TonB family protein